MTEIIMWISAIVFTGSVGIAANQLRTLPVDQYELGGWKTKRTLRTSGLSTDVRTMVFRIEGASDSPESWNALLDRLDDLHEQLSPFGENARRPAVEYRTWWGVTRVFHDAPNKYNRHYLDNYIDTLEKLAGVRANEQ